MIAAASDVLRVEPVLESVRPSARRRCASQDGAGLSYLYWPALRNPGRGAVVLLHDGRGYCMRMQRLVDELGLDDFALFAWNARSDDRSVGSRVKDLDRLVLHIGERHAVRSDRITLVAQGSDAVIAAAWARDYKPSIRCLVLAATAFRPQLHVSLRQVLLHGLHGASSGSRLRRLFDLEALSERLLADAHAIEVPVQMLVAGADWMVQRPPQLEFFQRLGSAHKELHVLHGSGHDVLGGLDQCAALARIRPFVDRAYVRTAPMPSLCSVVRNGDSIPDRVRLGGLRVLLRTLGRLSAGIRIGAEAGFDSDAAREYAHANLAQGRTRLGIAIDRIYLNSRGWKGIRMRNVHLQHAILCAAERLRAAGAVVRIVDIAAGQGRCVLDAVERLPEPPESVLLQDLDFDVVAEGAALIRQRKLERVASFVQGDAFDASALTALGPNVTLAVVAGLYEHFRENSLPERSLAGLGAALPAGGYLIYTSQTRCSDLERATRAPRGDGGVKSPSFRFRSQSELDRMVANAGFRKIEQWVDEWGMHTVSLAVRE